MKKIIFITLIFSVFNSCVSSTKKDPLKNTKKLVKEGHTSLYKNGAFQLPSTQLYLVPPGPGPVELASDLMGVKAKASFRLALQAAKDSVEVVSIGTKYTFEMASTQSEAGRAARKYIQSASRPTSKLIVLKTSEVGQEIVGQAWDAGEQTKKYNKKLIKSLADDRKNIETTRVAIRKSIDANSKELNEKSKLTAEQSNAHFVKGLSEAKNKWILGYATIDKKLDENKKDFENKKSVDRFVKTAKDAEIEREKNTNEIYYIFDGSFKKAKEDSLADFESAEKEFSAGSNTYGYTLATLRALGWWLKGTVWNYGFAAGKTMVSGVGYVLYNGVVYPVVVSSKQAANSVILAVEYSQLQSSNAYEYVAPTASLALAGILLSAKSVAGYSEAAAYKTVAITTKNLGPIATEGATAVGKTAVFATEKTIQYVGVPVTAAAVTTATAMTGAVVISSGYLAGGVTYAGGEASAYAADGVAKTTAAAVATVGTATSMVAGAAVGVFEVGQAMVVPPTLALSSGVVLSYGLASQLSAQAILSVADAAYLVLSLEGGKYVVYAVKGLVDPETDLPAGTIVDLEELRKRGEEIKKVPLSDDEVKGLTDKAIDHLPGQ